MALINCPECGKSVSDQASSCPSCGHPINSAAVTNTAFTPQTATAIPTKSRSIAILLAIFLGGIGIHKFYLNKPGWGVIYLLFCWTFIPLILALIEALIYLFMSDDKFQETQVINPTYFLTKPRSLGRSK